MANITAENTAAFIEYGGDWSDDSDDIRRATAPNSTLTLRFTGTALWAFGEFDGSVDVGVILWFNTIDRSNFSLCTLQCQLDGRICPNTTFQPSNVPDRPFLSIQNLVYAPHVLSFGYTGGAFGVSRLVWYDPNASTNEGSLMDPLADPAVYVGGRWNEQYYEIDGLNVRFQYYFSDGVAYLAADFLLSYSETRNASAYITFIFEGQIY
ncbi:hypothetical protein FRC09_020422 [Ceratobasidium sp. 395]|nr:hypothetical protein FRC09_020422 [Ceratobasidium sp. 395]